MPTSTYARASIALQQMLTFHSRWVCPLFRWARADRARALIHSRSGISPMDENSVCAGYFSHSRLLRKTTINAPRPATAVSSAGTQAARVRTHSRWTADIALAIVALVWGATFVVVKRALVEMSTMYFLALRFALASACMAAIFWPAFRRAERARVWRGLRGGLIVGLLLWLGYVLQSFGLKFTTAGNSGFLTGMYIVLVPLIGAAVYRRWPLFRELIGIGLASAGMIVMTIPGLDNHFGMNAGDLLTLGCAVAFACHLLLLGYFSQREFFPAVAFGQIACTAALSGVSLAV